MLDKRRHRFHICGFAFFALFLLITGCIKVGPDFVRPESRVAPGWRENSDQRVSTERSQPGGWWQIFHDPVLNQLIDRACRENLSLQIAGIRILQERARLGIAVGTLYPQEQSAAGSWQYNHLSQGAFLGGGAGSGATGANYTQAQISATAGWELDFWGRFRRAIEAADADWLSAIANYDDALVSLTADVANTYILIRMLEKRIEIARQNVEVQRENLSIAESRLQYGVISQLDVEQAQTILQNTLAIVPALDAQLKQALDALALLLGLPPGELSDLLKGSGEIPVAPAKVAVGIPADLLRRRPDIRRAEYQAASQCAKIGIAKADYYPAFSLNGTFGFLTSNVSGNALSDLFHRDNRTYQAGGSFQWSLFNYGRIANNVRLQDALFQELIAVYQNTVLTAQRDVEDNLIAFLRAQDQAAFLAQSARSAQRALDLAVLQYREGIRDFTTVLAAQQTLLYEQDSLASTLGSISSHLVGVYRALGGGWENRTDVENKIPPKIRDEMAKRTDWGKLLTPAAFKAPNDEAHRSLVRVPDW